MHQRVASSRWVYMNKDNKGFYRTRYCPRHFVALTKQLDDDDTMFSATEKVGLFKDTVEFVQLVSSLLLSSPLLYFTLLSSPLLSAPLLSLYFLCIPLFSSTIISSHSSSLIILSIYSNLLLFYPFLSLLSIYYPHIFSHLQFISISYLFS